MHFVALLCVMLAIAGGQKPRPNFDAERLRTGSYVFRTLVEGKDAGQGRIGINKSIDSGNYTFSNVITGSFSQSWEAVVSPTFAPVSAKLSLGQGNAARLVFGLEYHGTRVNGFVASQKESKRREVNETISDDTVDQRVDWAAAMALKEYVEGQEFQFHVYDPNMGNSLVRLRIGKSEKIIVPAGSFETVRVSYRIDKPGRAETYEVFVTKQTPRFLVKEKFPNGSVTELVSVNNSAARPN